MKFRLIHITTGLTLGEYKSRHPLTYYFGKHGPITDTDFQQEPVEAIVRADGAIGFQRKKPGYDEGELYFLKREDWRIETSEQPTQSDPTPHVFVRWNVADTGIADSPVAGVDCLSWDDFKNHPRIADLCRRIPLLVFHVDRSKPDRPLVAVLPTSHHVIGFLDRGDFPELPDWAGK